MYSKWIRKHNFDRYCEKYMVTCFELMDEEGYGCGDYEIDVRSWHEDPYSKRYKVADAFSEHRYKMTFRDKDEATRIWKWVVENEPDYDELKAVGFKKSTW